MRTLCENVPGELDDIWAGGAAGLALFAGCVYLDVDVDDFVCFIYRGRSRRRGLLKKIASGLVQQRSLLHAVNRRDDEQVGDLGEGLAVCRLQAADKVPLDGWWEERRLLGEFLGVVFAKVRVRERRLVEGLDVVCGLEFGHCYEADL